MKISGTGFMLRIMHLPLILSFISGKAGETYNIGGNNEWKNIDLIKLLCRIMDRKLDTARRNFGKAYNLCKRQAGT